MKLLVAGGFLFIGGCILYAVGTLGFADSAVKSHMMQLPQYMGLGSMLAGAISGVIGLKKQN